MQLGETVTAGVVVIGNEILSGRTQDKNLGWLAAELTGIGIRLAEAKVIPDIAATVIATLQDYSARFDYVFTTGGIGPTHDDITAACVAEAFGCRLIRDPRAVQLLDMHYPTGQLTEARLKMADIPEGAELIDNPVSAAPGFIVGNVHVMAGVPRIMQAMFDGLKPKLRGGAHVFSVTVTARIGESFMAKGLEAVQKEHPDIDIGSYPFYRSGEVGSSIVLRSTDTAELAIAADKVRDVMRALGVEPIEGELPGKPG
ncbi:MAG: molybdopterin-binding protein [Rhodospirillales bacterium]